MQVWSRLLNQRWKVAATAVLCTTTAAAFWLMAPSNRRADGDGHTERPRVPGHDDHPGIDQRPRATLRIPPSAEPASGSTEPEDGPADEPEQSANDPRETGSTTTPSVAEPARRNSDATSTDAHAQELELAIELLESADLALSEHDVSSNDAFDGSFEHRQIEATLLELLEDAYRVETGLDEQ